MVGSNQVEVVQSLDPTLDEAAVQAAKDMRFSPGRVGEVAVSVDITYTFTFVLD